MLKIPDEGTEQVITSPDLGVTQIKTVGLIIVCFLLAELPDFRIGGELVD